MARKKRPQYQEPSTVPPQREALVPFSDNQKTYLKLLRSTHTQVIGMGPAGTGKTFLPTVLAADGLMDGLYDKIIVTRPVVGTDGEELGYFPGGIEEKFGHWTIPVVEILERRMGKHRFRNCLFQGRIELAPLSTMRGRTLDNAFIILDEAQNTTYGQIKMFLTRTGSNSKTVITGDLAQSDIRGANGLDIVLSLNSRYNIGVPVVEFRESDCVRSEECAQWVSAFRRWEEEKNGVGS